MKDDTISRLPSAQPTGTNTVQVDDCISRQAAITWEILDSVIRNTVEELKAERRWIPCSERLPGDDDPYDVLCCDKRGAMMIGHVFESDESETAYSAESESEYMYDCVAWRLLPEPYKEDANGTD